MKRLHDILPHEKMNNWSIKLDSDNDRILASNCYNYSLEDGQEQEVSGRIPFTAELVYTKGKAAIINIVCDYDSSDCKLLQNALEQYYRDTECMDCDEAKEAARDEIVSALDSAAEDIAFCLEKNQEKAREILSDIIPEKISYDRLREIFNEHNKAMDAYDNPLYGVIVIKDFRNGKSYTDLQRSYLSPSNSWGWDATKAGNRQSGICLDGSESIRLDYYLYPEKMSDAWKIDYCYLVSKEKAEKIQQRFKMKHCNLSTVR